MADEPRRFLRDRATFAEPGARWAPAARQNPQELASAYLQHRASVAVEHARVARNPPMSVGDLAMALGETDEGALRRKLSGSRRASVGDVLGWAMVLGAEVADVVGVGSRLLPPEYEPWSPGWAPGDGLPVFRDPEESLRAMLRESSREVMDRWHQLMESGAGHLLVSESLRHLLVETLIARGLDAGHCFLEEPSPAMAALTVGALRRERIVTYCSTPGATTPESVAADLARAAESLLVGASGPEGGRFTLLALSSPVMIALRATLPTLASADLGARFNLPWDHLARLLPDSPGDLHGQLLAQRSWRASEILLVACDKVIPAP